MPYRLSRLGRSMWFSLSRPVVLTLMLLLLIELVKRRFRPFTTLPRGLWLSGRVRMNIFLSARLGSTLGAIRSQQLCPGWIQLPDGLPWPGYDILACRAI